MGNTSSSGVNSNMVNGYEVVSRYEDKAYFHSCRETKRGYSSQERHPDPARLHIPTGELNSVNQRITRYAKEANQRLDNQDHALSMIITTLAAQGAEIQALAGKVTQYIEEQRRDGNNREIPPCKEPQQGATNNMQPPSNTASIGVQAKPRRHGKR